MQTWLAHLATAYLSKQLKTTVHIDKVRIKFIKSVELKGFYVENLHHDTLLFAESLTIDINNFNIPKHIIDITKLRLANAKFFLTRYHGEDFDNIQFISDYFSSTDTVKPGAPWKIVLDKVQLANLNFKHLVQDNDTMCLHGVNFSNLDVKNINGDFDNVHLVNDSLFAYIHRLQFEDHSGFKVNEFTADAKISPTAIRLKDFILHTPQTNLSTDLTFNYDSFPDFGDFLEKVRFNSNFRNSTVSFDDIAYFATDLWRINRTVKLNGDFKGTVSKFRGKDVTIEFGNDTHFKGNIGLTGLPNVEETYFDVMADEITSSKRDVEKVPLAPFEMGNHVKLPDQLEVLGKVFFRGKFIGFYNDFVAYGNVSSDLGFLSSDINLKYDSIQKKEFYKGHLTANNFNIGKLAQAPDIGSTSFNAYIKGSGLRLDNADTKMKGVISLLQFKKYSYRNINVDGEISKKLFSGDLSIDEPNVALTFNGKINFKENLPQYNFTADVGHLHLDTLNLLNVPGEAELSSHLAMNFKGNKLENMEGDIQVSDFNYQADKTLYHINNITLTSEFVNRRQAIHLTSDNIDADFNGHFDFATVGEAFKQVLPQYFPAIQTYNKKIASDQDFRFDIRFKNMSLITERFFPLWKIDPNTHAKGSFNSKEKLMELTFTSPLIQFKNYTLHDERLHIITNKEVALLQSSAAQLYYSENSFIEEPSLSAAGKENQINFSMQLADSSVYSNRGSLKGNLVFQSPVKFALHLNEAIITLNNKNWTIDTGNSLKFDTSSIIVHRLAFASDSESVSTEGILSKRDGDKFDFSFNNFSLTNLNHLLQSDSITIGGIMNGSASLTDVYTKAKLVSDLTISNFMFNGDSIGNAAINSQYETETKAVKADITVMKREAKIISIIGEYFTDKENDNLDFDIQLRNIYLPPFEKYIHTVISNLQGKISSDLKLTGSFSKPVLNGTLDFSKTSCTVNYLNTTYSLNDRVNIGKNYFELKNFGLVDMRGNKAFASGKITHEYFKNFLFDINVQTDKFQALNTSFTQNELYYGVAYVSGTASFYGPIEYMNMEMRLRSEKWSDIHIPFSNTAEVAHSEFVTWRKPKNDTAELEAPKVNNSGITMNMTLEITPDATVEIVFDDKIGDKITGTGYSNLQLRIDEISGFQIFGNYQITKGTYLFTLKNIINKRFIIDPGSIISWNGNPYNAEISMTALYTGNTSTLYKLMDGDTTYRRRLNYQVELSLTNRLMNPNISYIVNVLGLDASDESRVSSKMHTEDETSRQVFGLLVLNQFLPPPNGPQTTTTVEVAGSGGLSSLGELASNQLSNWVSMFTNNVVQGVNYRAGDTYSKSEFDVLMSKSLFNDRLVIEGNVGYASDQATSNLVGEFNVEYLLREDGRLRGKAYNKSNTNNLLNYSAPYIQGLGVVYRKSW